jgi:hypothetical protein
MYVAILKYQYCNSCIYIFYIFHRERCKKYSVDIAVGIFYYRVRWCNLDENTM